MRAPNSARAELVRAAVKILRPGPAADSAATIRDVVEDAFNIVDLATVSADAEANKHDASKTTRLALLRYKRALENAARVRRLVLRSPGPGTLIALVGTSDVFEPAINNELDIVNRLLELRAKPTRFDPRARSAVANARCLLDMYRIPALATRKRGGKAGGYWLQLAAILYGDRKKDLHHVIDEYRRAPWGVQA
jgi:hypothetical protein